MLRLFRIRNYRALGLAGCALLLVAPLLPFRGLSPLGETFLAFSAGAALSLSGLAVLTAFFTQTRRIAFAMATAALYAYPAHSYFTAYYYPAGEGALFGESAQRATAVPGWACVEVGLVLLLLASAGFLVQKQTNERAR